MSDVPPPPPDAWGTPPGAWGTPPGAWGTPPGTPVAAPRRGVPGWLVGAGAVVAVLVVLGAIGAVTSDGDEPGVRGNEPAESAECGVIRDHVVPAGLQHRTGPIEYDASPPYGGVHNGVPLPAFRRVIHRDSAPELVVERAVHNLEHGYVVVWYGEDVSEERVNEVGDALAEAGVSKALVVPYAGTMDASFTLAAWGHTQACARPDAAALRAFWDAHGGPNGEAPEASAP